MKAFERFGIDLYTIYGVETDVAWSMSGTWVCRSIEVYLPRVKTQWQQRYFSLWSFNSEICANSLKINTLASGRNLEFSRQNNQIARGFAQEFIWSGKRCIPSQRLKRCGKSSSLHSKKSFWFGMRIFGEWHDIWRTSRSPWPTLPDPGCQQLDGSISLKFLLETRLQSESFDTLDDWLGFWVQKLWSKAIKIFD